MASNRARNAIATSWTRTWHLLLIGAAFALTISRPALAVPVQAHYIDTTDCDANGAQFPTHELGEPAGTFPIDELIQVSIQAGPTVCVPDDGFPNDFLVSITNMGSVSYENLYFVVDTGSSVGNFDGLIEDLLGAPGVFERAFKIDGTVTSGINDNLLSESMTIDEIFEPGETWEFLATNFTAPASMPPMPVFQSPGLFAGSSPAPPSSASIVATPVPEPSASLLLGLGMGALALFGGRAERSSHGAGSHGGCSRIR